MFNNTFYHGLIRKHVIIFGTLFNDIFIERVDSTNSVVSLQKVPLTYAKKDKMISRLTQDPNLDRPFSVLLPRMSFAMTNMQYDPSRKLNNVHKLVRKDADPNKNKYTFTPVPYNFFFTLYVYVKNTEDGTRIIENILPNFTPDFTPNVRLVPEMNYEQKIPVIMTGSPSYTDNAATGQIQDTRLIVWEIPFIVKGYLLGPIKSAKIIKFAEIQLTDDTNTLLYDQVNVSPGLTANGQPTSLRSETVDQNTIFATDDFGFIIEGLGDV
jgi:hypothetical protein